MANVVIYTRDYCGYCARAKRLLDDKGIAYTEHNASIDPARREEMIKRSGRRTFPQVFIDDLHVGGSDDLAAFERSGRLVKALEGAL
jgi:glutaredoxin 3